MTFSHVLLLTFPFSPLLWPPHDPSDKPVSSQGAVLLQPNEFPFHFANVVAPGWTRPGKVSGKILLCLHCWVGQGMSYKRHFSSYTPVFYTFFCVCVCMISLSYWKGLKTQTRSMCSDCTVGLLPWWYPSHWGQSRAALAGLWAIIWSWSLSVSTKQSWSWSPGCDGCAACLEAAGIPMPSLSEEFNRVGSPSSSVDSGQLLEKKVPGATVPKREVLSLPPLIRALQSTEAWRCKTKHCSSFIPL